MRHVEALTLGTTIRKARVFMILKARSNRPGGPKTPVLAQRPRANCERHWTRFSKYPRSGMGNDRTKLQGPFALDPDDEAGWRAIAEMSQSRSDCEHVGERDSRRLAAMDENGWRNIATAWEDRERESAAAELASLRSLVEEVLDHWHSDRWALSPFVGIREWQKKALEAMAPKNGMASTAAPSLHAGSDLRFAEVNDDAPVWL
jgi:hypothetical protein